MIVVLKITGKAFDKDLDSQERYGGQKFNVEVITETVKALLSEKHRVAVVVGGGKTARRYISVARKLGVREAFLDQIGIESSRLNARLLSVTSDIYIPKIPKSLDELEYLWRGFQGVPVIGGLQPGQSTSGVAALVAETVGADVLMELTTVNGVYDKDPQRFSDARLLDRISLTELQNILYRGGQSVNAGSYELIDPIAIKILMRTGIRLYVMSFDDAPLIPSILRGDIKVGTLVEPR